MDHSAEQHTDTQRSTDFHQATIDEPNDPFTTENPNSTHTDCTPTTTTAESATTTTAEPATTTPITSFFLH